MANIEEKPAAMVLGTYHMGNRGQSDAYQFYKDDSQSQQKREIRECVELLKDFQPTKVVVEFDAETGQTLKDDFEQYKRGNLTLEADEIHQLGFQIASELNHDTIYPVDWNNAVGNIGMGDVFHFAQENQPELYEQMKAMGDKLTAETQRIMDNTTIREALLHINQYENQKKQQEMYMQYVLAGEGTNYIGIDWVANYWYRRNMNIFTNISRIASAEDRLLVIYGSGHKYLLDQFMDESGMYHLEEVVTYLGDGAR